MAIISVSTGPEASPRQQVAPEEVDAGLTLEARHLDVPARVHVHGLLVRAERLPEGDHRVAGHELVVPLGEEEHGHGHGGGLPTPLLVPAGSALRPKTAAAIRSSWAASGTPWVVPMETPHQPKGPAAHRGSVCERVQQEPPLGDVHLGPFEHGGAGPLAVASPSGLGVAVADRGERLRLGFRVGDPVAVLGRRRAPPRPHRDR